MEGCIQHTMGKGIPRGENEREYLVKAIEKNENSGKNRGEDEDLLRTSAD